MRKATILDVADLRGRRGRRRTFGRPARRVAAKEVPCASMQAHSGLRVVGRATNKSKHNRCYMHLGCRPIDWRLRGEQKTDHLPQQRERSQLADIVPEDNTECPPESPPDTGGKFRGRVGPPNAATEWGTGEFARNARKGAERPKNIQLL